MINKDYIMLDLNIKDKEGALDFISIKAREFGICDDEKGVLKDMLIREEEFSTDLGMGISIPHAKSDHVLKASILFLRYHEDIKWGEDTKVKGSIVFLSPKNNKDNIHLKMLAKVSRKLMDKSFLKLLLEDGNKEEIFQGLEEAINQN